MVELQEIGTPLGVIILIAAILIVLVRDRILQGRIKALEKQKQELLARKEMHDRSLVEIRARSEMQVGKEKEKTSEVRSELERQKEIAKIAASISNEQSKKLMFFTNLAQEFRNPLTLIMGAMDNVLSGEYGRLPGKLRRQLEMILRSSRQLVRFMDQFHDISKLQTGQMEIKVSRRNLSKFLKEIISTLAWYSEKKRINLDFQTPNEEIEAVFDSQKMAEVFYHLLSNAFRFTPENGKILVSLAQIPNLESESGEETIEVKIRNSGDAIPQESIPFLFDVFHRPGTDGNRPQIGLSLVKELVSLHGGTIRVRSEPEIGTEFTVILPRGIASSANLQTFDELEDESLYDFSERAKMEISTLEIDEPEQNGAKIKKKPVRVASETRSILIVEDNHDVRELLKGGFRDLYTISEASNGREALEKAKQLRPDIIITDVMMPEMDGIDLCRSLKADEELSSIPIILLTAKPSEINKIEGMQAGADEYVSKPFRFEELFEKVENLTKQRSKSV